jgi:hypothetical protein
MGSNGWPDVPRYEPAAGIVDVALACCVAYCCRDQLDIRAQELGALAVHIEVRQARPKGATAMQRIHWMHP